MIGGADTYDNDIYYWMDGSKVEDGYVKYVNSYCMYCKVDTSGLKKAGATEVISFHSEMYNIIM